jgi:branched-chain amino acid transport system ATP-binding protein
MLAIGRALASSPKLLLLDESSLDSPMMADEIFAHIERVHSESGVTVVLVEQRVAETLTSCDRGYVLEFREDHARGAAEGPLGA